MQWRNLHSTKICSQEKTMCIQHRSLSYQMHQQRLLLCQHSKFTHMRIHFPRTKEKFQQWLLTLPWQTNLFLLSQTLLSIPRHLQPKWVMCQWKMPQNVRSNKIQRLQNLFIKFSMQTHSRKMHSRKMCKNNITSLNPAKSKKTNPLSPSMMISHTIIH